MRPDIIAIYGGATDNGPFSLGAGQSKYAHAATRSEWREVMQARAAAGGPPINGTEGTCGADQTVDWIYDNTCELGLTIRVARLYSSTRHAWPKPWHRVASSPCPPRPR